MITSEAIQRWARVALYVVFGGLANHGLTVSTSSKETIVSIVGLLATAAWTKYGSTLSSMLAEVEKTQGVEKVELKVDPEQINPHELNQATPAAVVVKSVEGT